ncbi:unnamed protein product, partial [Ectocarpus sp. 13 AM-2016]
HQALPEWPIALLDIYMHDALGGRQWASHSACKPFVDNVRTAWAPPTPPQAKPDRRGSPVSSSESGAAAAAGSGGS